MGVIIRGECACGYASGPILEGIGMDPDGGETAMAICEACRELIPVSVPTANAHCPLCEAPVKQVYRCWEGGRLVTDSGAAAFCPQCGASELVIEVCGVWD